MSASPLELHVSLWSANRCVETHDSNDFEVDLHGRHNVRAAMLSSAELPMTQQTIETGWQNFLWDCGWEPWTRGGSRLGVRGPNFVYDTPLPPQAQRCALCDPPTVSLDGVTYTHWRSRSASHALPQTAAGLEAFQPRLTILSTSLDRPSVELPIARVLGESEFLCSLPPPDIVVTQHQEGLLLLGQICSPRALMHVLVDYTMQALSHCPNHMAMPRVSYILDKDFLVASVLPSPHTETTRQGSFTLEGLDGLPGLTDVSLPVRVPLSSLAAHFASPCFLPVGNYDGASLRMSLEVSMDPLSFWQRAWDEGQLVLYYNGQRRSQFSPALEYCAHPGGIAQRLETYFQQLGGDGSDIQVRYVNETFVLSSSATPVAVGGALAPLFGWTPGVQGYRLVSETRPVSRHAAAVTLQCPGTPLPSAPLTAPKSLLFVACRRPLPSTVKVWPVSNLSGCARLVSPESSGPVYHPSYEVPIGTWLVVYLPTSQSHASVWCVGEVCQEETVEGKTWLIAKFERPLSNDNGASLVARVIPHVSRSALLPLNLYFYPPPSVQWPRLAEILGFPPGWTGSSGGDVCSLKSALVAPFALHLDHPSFLLVELNLGQMNVNLVHWVQNDYRGNLFAKLPVYCHTRWERTGMLQKAGQGTTVVSSFRVRLLNPWLQLYQTHGVNWSATLTLLLATMPVQLP